jgi:hypothetical protein
MRVRIGVVVGVALAVGLVAGAGYAGVVRQLAVGESWAVVGRQIDDDVDGRPQYVTDFTPDTSDIRFALMLRNDGPLPMTVRLPQVATDPAGDFDQIVELRLDKPAGAEGSLSMGSTVGVDEVEIPAYSQRWVDFGGRSATCPVAAIGNAEAMQARQAVRLELDLLGIERDVSVALPFVQLAAGPAKGVCP